jgi:hypothetical protein
MVGAMSPLSRKLLRYGAPAALFACGAAFLMTGRSAAVAWTLIVVSLAGVAQRANARAAETATDPGCDQHAHIGEPRVTEERRHRAQSRRSLSGPR